MSYHRRQATVAEIEAYAAKVAAQFRAMKVAPNGYGVRIECAECHASATLNPEMWARNHACA